MSKKLRVGVIGCGAIGSRLHVPDYTVCPYAEIVALCDIIPAKAKELAEKWAPNAKIYSDYKKMLKEAMVLLALILEQQKHGAQQREAKIS